MERWFNTGPRLETWFSNGFIFNIETTFELRLSYYFLYLLCPFKFVYHLASLKVGGSTKLFAKRILSTDAQRRTLILYIRYP